MTEDKMVEWHHRFRRLLLSPPPPPARAACPPGGVQRPASLPCPALGGLFQHHVCLLLSLNLKSPLKLHVGKQELEQTLPFPGFVASSPHASSFSVLKPLILPI